MKFSRTNINKLTDEELLKEFDDALEGGDEATQDLIVIERERRRTQKAVTKRGEGR